MDIQLFLQEHIPVVYDHEQTKLAKTLNPIQKEMESWQNSWRKESLKYYCEKGWSFVAFRDDTLQGYVLAQPLLFFNNWTQSLWLEHLSFDSEDIGEELIKVCIGWAKTKHFQKVLVNSRMEHSCWIQKRFHGFQPSGYLHLPTTKIKEP